MPQFIVTIPDDDPNTSDVSPTEQEVTRVLRPFYGNDVVVEYAPDEDED